ncbi:MAG: hypothetical protein KBC62_04495 [Candidatus Pacebacteria bacterium]|nr:hypothetical protein [Candidatus Paceibacterota bacterium]MBP9843233.1 hypothetical protein [Candidatus Paceibacterota bacterium]
MINLIPPTAKKGIRTEYWLRVVTTWFILITGALVASIAVMAPAFVLINLQIGASAESSAVASQKIAGYESVANELKRSNVEAKAVLDTTAYIPISDQIAIIRKYEGLDITISDIVISRSKDGFSPIQVTGRAVSRQSLSQFRESLLAEPSIATVDLPISNLAKDRDIQFNLSVTVKKLTP